MWYRCLFKPKRKLTVPVTEAAVPATPSTSSLSRVLEKLDVDEALVNPSYKRLLVKTYSLDVAQLLNCIYTDAKVSSIETGVSLYDYFRVTQLPPSECLARMVAGVASNKASAAVKSDIEAIVTALEEIVYLMNKGKAK